MKLHRTGNRPQWESVSWEKRNLFQHVAAATYGIATPANAVSLAGAGLVLRGLHDIVRGNAFWGAAEIAFGRGADIPDGYVADLFGTVNKTGEIVDAAGDKILMLAALPVLVREGMLPKTPAGIILAQDLVISGLSAAAKYKHNELHPSAKGKLTAFGHWAVTGFYAAAELARRSEAHTLADGLEIAGYVSTATTFALGCMAIAGYARETLFKTAPIAAG